jgi:hypothetical protein
MVWRQIETSIPYGVVQHAIVMWEGLLLTAGGYKSTYLEDEEEEAEEEEDEEYDEEEQPEEEETVEAPEPSESSSDDTTTTSEESEDEEDAYGWVTNEVEMYPIDKTVASLPQLKLPKPVPAPPPPPIPLSAVLTDMEGSSTKLGMHTNTLQEPP